MRKANDRELRFKVTTTSQKAQRPVRLIIMASASRIDVDLTAEKAHILGGIDSGCWPVTILVLSVVRGSLQRASGGGPNKVEEISKKDCGPGGIRTPIRRFAKTQLCPLSYRATIWMGTGGLEPPHRKNGGRFKVGSVCQFWHVPVNERGWHHAVPPSLAFFARYLPCDTFTMKPCLASRDSVERTVLPYVIEIH